MNVRDLLRTHRINPDPGYYSGRGLARCDLNIEQIIEIGREISEASGGQWLGTYVRMVERLPVISATAFIRRLLDLEYNDWKLGNAPPASGIEVNCVAQGFATIFDTLGRDADKPVRDAAVSKRWKAELRSVLIDGEPFNPWRRRY